MQFHLIDQLEIQKDESELLEHLLDMKINYLSRKIFGDSERGLPTDRDVQRRERLVEIKNNLRANLENMEADQLVVSCVVNVEQLKVKQTA